MSQSNQNEAPRPLSANGVDAVAGTDAGPQIRHAASAAVFNVRGVLLVRRGRPPLSGLWSLPGGHLESGETPASAAAREVMEEAAVSATILAHVGLHTIEALDRDGRPLRYLIEVHAGIAPNDAEPVAGDDASDARFVALHELNRYALTNGAAQLIAKAAGQLSTAGHLLGANPRACST